MSTPPEVMLHVSLSLTTTIGIGNLKYIKAEASLTLPVYPTSMEDISIRYHSVYDMLENGLIIHSKDLIDKVKLEAENKIKEAAQELASSFNDEGRQILNVLSGKEYKKPYNSIAGFKAFKKSYGASEVGALE